MRSAPEVRPEVDRRLAFDRLDSHRRARCRALDGAAGVFLAVDCENHLALLRLRSRAAHGYFQRARIDRRQRRALNEHVLGGGVADVVQHELRLRRRLEIGEPQRRGALLHIRNQVQHDRRTRRAQPVVRGAHRISVVQPLDARLQAAQRRRESCRPGDAGTDSGRPQRDVLPRSRSITRSDERRSPEPLSASASARCQRSPCCIDSDLSITIACKRAFAFGGGTTRSVSSGPANASTSAMSNRIRSDNSNQYRNVRFAVRCVSLASSEHQRGERMLRRVRARHAVQPDRHADREQAEQECRREEHALAPALAEQQITPQRVIQRLVRRDQHLMRADVGRRLAQRRQDDRRAVRDIRRRDTPARH